MVSTCHIFLKAHNYEDIDTQINRKMSLAQPFRTCFSNSTIQNKIKTESDCKNAFPTLKNFPLVKLLVKMNSVASFTMSINIGFFFCFHKTRKMLRQEWKGRSSNLYHLGIRSIHKNENTDTTDNICSLLWMPPYYIVKLIPTDCLNSTFLTRTISRNQISWLLFPFEHCSFFTIVLLWQLFSWNL